MSRRRCVLRCDRKYVLFSLPKDEEVRNQWLEFIFTAIPQQYNPNLNLCSRHFTDDCFLNLGQFSAGFAKILSMADGAVPSLFGPTRSSESLPQIPASANMQQQTNFLLNFGMDTRKEMMTKNGMEDVADSSDEELGLCDQESVATSVDSTAEDMFVDGLDPYLDCTSSTDIDSPNEDCDSETSRQQTKRSRLSSTSTSSASFAAFGGRERWSLPSASGEQWHSADEADVEPSNPVFTPLQTPGPKFVPNSCGRPLHFFQLFFPKSVLQIIVENTNIYGAKCQVEKDIAWHDISMKDLQSFLAVVIYMDLMKCSSLKDYWGGSQYFSLSFPSRIMSYQRFLSISKVLHLSDPRNDEENNMKRKTSAYERLGKIKPIYQHVRDACKTFFHPFQNIIIDEKMVAARVRKGHKQSMKIKSADRGFKLFALVDCACGYTWDFFVYEGKSYASQSEGLSYESVMALVDENLLGTGYKLFVDQFYTSPKLFRDLLRKEIWACGTVRANRRGCPKTTENRLPRDAPRGSIRWIRDNDLLFVNWKDTQEVQICSTFHKAYGGDTVRRKVTGGDKHQTLVNIPIPAAVLEYNRNIRAVDMSCSITAYYRVMCKPRKWYQSIFYYFLDIAVENAFILQELMAKVKNQKALSRKAFLETLVLELAGIRSQKKPRIALVPSAPPSVTPSACPSTAPSMTPAPPSVIFSAPPSVTPPSVPPSAATSMTPSAPPSMIPPASPPMTPPGPPAAAPSTTPPP